MQGTGLFEQALGLERPVYVERTEFDAGQRRLDLYLNFEVGGTFACGGCGGEGCKAYDTAQKQWRHLNFFQHQAYLHAPSPRVECAECGIRQARLPWARPRSGFTLLFEALAMAMMSEMPVKAVARIVGEHDTRLWRIARHHVNEARAAADHSGVRAVGVDEKASRRGHSYVTFFADLDERRLLYATEGRKWGVLGEFRADLEAHGGSADSVEELCMDMSPAYIKGARESFPDAEITCDRFHIVRLLNQAVEKVRRTEQKERPELKRSRWLWLWNPERLSPAQRQRLRRTAGSVTDRACHGPGVSAQAVVPGVLEPASGAGQAASGTMVRSRRAKRSCTDGHHRRDDPRPHNRHPPLASLPDQQRHAGSHELARPGCKGTGARLPHHRELHHHGLPRLRQAHFQPTHLKQRGALSLGSNQIRLQCRVALAILGHILT